jgi:hypothetical protein
LASRCTPGTGALVHYGVTMSQSSQLRPDSFLMTAKVAISLMLGVNPQVQLVQGIAISRSSVPLDRSRWVVIAATMNMLTNGNTPMYSGATRFGSRESDTT